MSDVDIALIFTFPDRGYCTADMLIEDADLRGSHDLFEDCAMGLSIEGDGGPIFIEDEFERIESQLISIAADYLSEGKSVTFRYYDPPDKVEFRVEGDSVTIDDGDGNMVTLSQSDAVAQLGKAKADLEKIKSLVGA